MKREQPKIYHLWKCPRCGKMQEMQPMNYRPGGTKTMIKCVICKLCGEKVPFNDAGGANANNDLHIRRSDS